MKSESLHPPIKVNPFAARIGVVVTDHRSAPPPPVGLRLSRSPFCQLVWGPWPEEAASLTRKDWEELAAAADSESRSPEQAGHSR